MKLKSDYDKEAMLDVHTFNDTSTYITDLFNLINALSTLVNSSRYETYGARNDYRGRGLRVGDTGQRGALLEA